jgi:hypothetical protein
MHFWPWRTTCAGLGNGEREMEVAGDASLEHEHTRFFFNSRLTLHQETQERECPFLLIPWTSFNKSQSQAAAPALVVHILHV